MRSSDKLFSKEDSMPRYIVYSSYLSPSKVKGELPDVTYEYIANDSMIPWHYTFTRNIEKAYFFDEFEKDKAKEIALLWSMKMKQLDV